MAKRTEAQQVRNEDEPLYNIKPGTFVPCSEMSDQQIIDKAVKILERAWPMSGPEISNPASMVQFLHLKFNEGEVARKEMFYILCLNAKNKIICCKQISMGTVDQCAVYPREVVRLALVRDAATIILAHNHPSGDPTPSSHDNRLTQEIVKACNIMSIRVHDHIILGAPGYYSYAENGVL